VQVVFQLESKLYRLEERQLVVILQLIVEVVAVVFGQNLATLVDLEVVEEEIIQQELLLEELLLKQVFLLA
jgi:hypothetical protein